MDGNSLTVTDTRYERFASHLPDKKLQSGDGQHSRKKRSASVPKEREKTAECH